jgi:hypothetical protein
VYNRSSVQRTAGAAIGEQHEQRSAYSVQQEQRSAYNSSTVRPAQMHRQVQCSADNRGSVQRTTGAALSVQQEQRATVDR